MCWPLIVYSWLCQHLRIITFFKTYQAMCRIRATKIITLYLLGIFIWKMRFQIVFLISIRVLNCKKHKTKECWYCVQIYIRLFSLDIRPTVQIKLRRFLFYKFLTKEMKCLAQLVCNTSKKVVWSVYLWYWGFNNESFCSTFDPLKTCKII